jgi:hypothetical protein
MRDSGDDAGAVTVATAGENQQERRRCALAKVFANAVFGDAACMRLTAKPTDDPKSEKEPEPACKGFSQAAAWEAEPEWTGEASEEMAETMSGGREPEN